MFTAHLLAGLRGAAGRDDGFVRVRDLFAHVERNVVARAPRQAPVLHAASDDNFVIARASRAPPALIALAHRPGPTRFAYDALVVHADDARDRGWASHVLARQLEDRGLRVCVEGRATPRLGDLERLVASSRFTVPILTPRFSPARFEDLQTAMALQLGIDDAHHRLIPIVREPCDAGLAVRMLVSLELAHDHDVEPGIERLVHGLRG